MSQDPMAVSLDEAETAQAVGLAEASQQVEAQHHLVAVFESAAHADAARAALAQAGVDPASTQIVGRRQVMHDMEDAAQAGAWGAAHTRASAEDMQEHSKLIFTGQALQVAQGNAAEGYHVAGRIALPQVAPPGHGAETTPPPAAGTVPSAFAGRIANGHGLDHLPLPHDDLHEYAKLMDEGYALLVVRGDAAAGYHATGQILERHKAVDFEATLARWRNDGWATPAQAAAVPVAMPAHVPESARMASILIQRGQGAAPQNQQPEILDGFFRHRPEIAAPDPVAAAEASPDYAQANHPEAAALPDTGPTRRERRLVRDFVAHQSIADAAGGAPAAAAGPPIRVYRPHHA